MEFLFADEQAGVAWLRGSHNALVFGGQAPIELLTSGSRDALMTVWRFLDGARRGLYTASNKIDADFQPYEDSEIVFRWPMSLSQAASPTTGRTIVTRSGLPLATDVSRCSG